MAEQRNGASPPEQRPGEAGAGQGAAAPRRGYIPRPPSKEDIDRVSEAQGMITDEWAGEAPSSGAGEGGGARRD